MYCCSSFFSFFKANFFTRAGAGAGQKKTLAGAGQKWTGSATLTEIPVLWIQNALNLDPYPGFWFNLDPDPGLYHQF